MKQATIITITILAAIALTLTTILSESRIQTIKNCRVIELKALPLTSGSSNSFSTSYRYLVVTDKETFISEASLLNEKYSNADLFYQLKKDSIYNFKVCGLGKTLLTDYRNILSIQNK